MFSVTVLKLKDIKKYFIGMVLTIIVIIFASKYIPQFTNEKKSVNKINFQNNMIGSLKQSAVVMSDIDGEKLENNNKKEKNILHSVLNTQIASIQGMTIGEVNQINEEEKEETKNNNENQNTQLAETGLSTQVITNNPITESFNSQYGSVKIKNETEYELTEELLTPDVTIENKNIILFHTHSCESYTSSDAYPYTPTGNFRTTDLNYTVTRVGTELENYLKQYNFSVNHDTSYHDYPSYNGSYASSLETVENILKTYPSDIIIDLHRDAIGSRSDYAPIVKIGDEDVAAQIMFVIRNK